jgi:hypothetical protein
MPGSLPRGCHLAAPHQSRAYGPNRRGALALYALRKAQGVAWDPREDGFDFSPEEFQARMKRDGIARFPRMAEKFGWNVAKMQAYLDEISGKEVA